jgi:hypothetical protein
MTTRVLLALRMNPRVLENLRYPLKRILNPRLLDRHTLLLPLFPQGTRGKRMRLSTLAPPRPALLLPKKLFLLKRGQLSTLTPMLSSARKFLSLFYCSPLITLTILIIVLPPFL